MDGQLTGVIRNKDNPRFGDPKKPTKEMITVNEELKLTIVRGFFVLLTEL